MLTAFGRFLRKLRIDRQELLKDMSAKLNVSSAYLSAVETGKRKIPASWVSIISNLYHLSKDEQADLQDAYELSAQEVRINLVNASDYKREAAISFAKALDGLDDKALKKIMDTMKKKR